MIPPTVMLKVINILRKYYLYVNSFVRNHLSYYQVFIVDKSKLYAAGSLDIGAGIFTAMDVWKAN